MLGPKQAAVTKGNQPEYHSRKNGRARLPRIMAAHLEGPKLSAAQIAKNTVRPFVP
jgi:hypothetical protein